jgi:magnesium chelatase family protein
MRAYCKPSDEVKGLLRAAIQQLGLSARAYDRLLKVSRAIADLEGTKDIEVAHVAEAIQYRSLDRKFWGNKHVLHVRDTITHLNSMVTLLNTRFKNS